MRHHPTRTGILALIIDDVAVAHGAALLAAAPDLRRLAGRRRGAEHVAGLAAEQVADIAAVGEKLEVLLTGLDLRLRLGEDLVLHLPGLANELDLLGALLRLDRIDQPRRIGERHTVEQLAQRIAETEQHVV